MFSINWKPFADDYQLQAGSFEAANPEVATYGVGAGYYRGIVQFRVSVLTGTGK
jgi:hypothetical protein